MHVIPRSGAQAQTKRAATTFLRGVLPLSLVFTASSAFTPFSGASGNFGIFPAAGYQTELRLLIAQEGSRRRRTSPGARVQSREARLRSTAASGWHLSDICHRRRAHACRLAPGFSDLDSLSTSRSRLACDELHSSFPEIPEEPIFGSSPGGASLAVWPWRASTTDPSSSGQSASTGLTPAVADLGQAMRTERRRPNCRLRDRSDRSPAARATCAAFAAARRRCARSRQRNQPPG